MLLEPLYIPVSACGASLAVLLLFSLARSPTTQTEWSNTGHHASEGQERNEDQPDDQSSSTFSGKARTHVHARGGPVVYTFHVVRIMGCLALLGFSMTAGIPLERKPQIAVAVAYGYATLLSLFALVPRADYRQFCGLNATFVLVVQFGVFAWRNIFPLTMFGGMPADASSPWLLWSSGVLVTVVAVLIPLLIPRIYHPLDPNNPASTPSPEQTASILSLILYSFLDPVVFTASRVPTLPYERLPPLPDYDWAKHLAARSFDRLDPLRREQNGLRKQRLFFGLLRIFGWEYFAAAFLVVFSVIVRIVGPIAVNNLLIYLETDGQDAVFRPWAWVLLLFCGTSVFSLVMNLYYFIATGVVLQVENILIQLIFERSLKIRTVDTSSAPRPPNKSDVTASMNDIDLDEDTLTESTPDGTVNSSETGAGTPSTTSSTAPNKVKHKKAVQQAIATAEATSEAEPKTAEIAGRINTLLGTDLPNILMGRDWLYVLQIPLGIIVEVWYLYRMLDWASVVGLAVTVLGLPLPGVVARLVSKVQEETMQKTETRVQSVSEVMGMLRMTKMFAWEARVNDDIAKKRGTELAYVMKKKILDLINRSIVVVLPLLTMIVTFAFYTLVMKKELDASRLFPSIAVFEMLRWDLQRGLMWVNRAISAGVSLARVNDFICNTQLLDIHEAATDLSTPPVEHDVVGFHQATFTWMNNHHGTHTPTRRDFQLHIDDLVFKKNVINLIVGPTGCGKTSLLLALLGEMHFQSSGPGSWFSLPRSLGVSYASQEPWVLNETLKRNILFDEPFDAERYKKVLHQCALDPDLALFEAGDETEVGEKGLTLSGGQKARVTLARAVYSRAHIVLLDDVLSALDVHTSRWIVDKCFRGDLLRDRTVLLVTHNVAIAAPIAENVISLDLNGCISSQGTVLEALSNDLLLRPELEEAKTLAENSHSEDMREGNPKAMKADGKLILAEEIAEGRLTWGTARFFLDGFGGLVFWAVCLSGYIFVHLGNVIATWWLGVWASAYKGSTIDVSVPYYLGIYAIIMGARTIINAITYVLYIFASLESCRKIHERLCQSVLRAPLRWLDTTPTGRIISRFTQDINEVDVTLPNELDDLIQLTTSMAMGFAAVVFMSPIFALPGIVLLAAGAIVGRVYIAAQLAVKRQRSNWRSPLYNHFSAAAAGLVSIRAFGAEQSFRTELQLRLDGYSRPSLVFYNLNRWMMIRTDMLGSLFSAGLAAYLSYSNKGIGPSNTGFSLNMALSFSELIIWWIATMNEIEIAGNSLERILNYVEIEQEPPPTEAGRPPAYWPSSGSIRVEHLSARYSADGPIVLNNLTFDIKSGERVAIVGRTGSGKSSLALSLLRLIPSTGVVYFDGRPTHELNLDALRTNLAIIPQDPMLISGTLRSNLDPFSEYDDAPLNDALGAAGLFRLQHDNDENKITLDTHVFSGGSNFSVGQRQIIALARAIIHGAKVLILDEATASVDTETDNIIQAFLRDHLAHTTLITIAHRLQTIADYDKIIVLDRGRLVEMDSPIALLESGGFFCDLVQQSGERDKLWEMARKVPAR